MANTKWDFSIADYFKVPLNEIVSGRKREFPLFIYLPTNERLLLRSRTDEDLPDTALETLFGKGLRHFWCPNDFKSLWDAYLQVTDPALSARTEEGADAIEILQAENIGIEEKEQALTALSLKMLKEFSKTDSADRKPKAEALDKLKAFAEDIIDFAIEKKKSKEQYDQIRAMQPATTFQHSMLSATFTVLFALALGLCEKRFLADISMGALLHDIGFVELDPELLSTPFEQMNADQKVAYESHCLRGCELIEKNQIDSNSVIQAIIEDHHERFNGTGFPSQKKAGAVSIEAQIVGLADFFEDLVSGRFDGKPLSPKGALVKFEQICIENHQTKVFEPQLCEALVGVLKEIV